MRNCYMSLDYNETFAQLLYNEDKPNKDLKESFQFVV